LPINLDSQSLFEAKSICRSAFGCAKNSFAIMVIGGIAAIPNLSVVGAKSKGSVFWRSLEGETIGGTIHAISACNFEIS
jgi:hypothetical protein